MWLLIEVDHSTDVGKNEKNRYLLSDNLTIVDNISSVAVVALGERVHPRRAGHPEAANELAQKLSRK